MFVRFLTAGVCALALWPGKAGALDAAEVIERLAGEFVADAVGGSPGQQAVQMELRVASIPERILFMQWRAGAAPIEGEVSRLRLWAVREDDDGVVLSILTFRDAGAFVDLHRNALLRAALQQQDLIAFPPGCSVRLRREGERIFGSVDHGDCRLDRERHGHAVDLAYSLELTQDGFTFSETAHDRAGGVAYRMPESGRYVFRRR